MYVTVYPLFGPGSIPSHGRVFQGIFPWLITLCQPVLSQGGRKRPNLPSMAPHDLWTRRRKAKVQLWTDYGWKKSQYSKYINVMTIGCSYDMKAYPAPVAVDSSQQILLESGQNMGSQFQYQPAAQGETPAIFINAAALGESSSPADKLIPIS